MLRGDTNGADFAFVVCEVGAPASETRARADELCDFVLRPPLEEHGLRLGRADEDPTPGTVTVQIVQSIVNAAVVIADLTGQNPNVYYELAIAHAFAKPVIILVDAAASLAFDLQGERAIVIGDNGAEIGARKAALAADEVRRQLDVVLATDYVPQSLVRGAAVTASLAQFATENPMQEQIVRIAEQLEELRNQRIIAPSFVTSGVYNRPDRPRRLESTISGPSRVTPEIVLRFRERTGSLLSERQAFDVLESLPLRHFYFLSRLWGLDTGVPAGSLVEVAAEFGVSVEAADLLRQESISLVRERLDAMVRKNEKEAALRSDSATADEPSGGSGMSA